eukprot:GFUD01107047.1.p1 GENE.GFUD01107047.1~~GFUD01107047.1.p1  ORF type:complete len:117 (+),score=18.35 GFUD01107047.1:127-477(+)
MNNSNMGSRSPESSILGSWPKAQDTNLGSRDMATYSNLGSRVHKFTQTFNQQKVAMQCTGTVKLLGKGDCQGMCWSQVMTYWGISWPLGTEALGTGSTGALGCPGLGALARMGTRW